MNCTSVFYYYDHVYISLLSEVVYRHYIYVLIPLLFYLELKWTSFLLFGFI